MSRDTLGISESVELETKKEIHCLLIIRTYVKTGPHSSHIYIHTLGSSLPAIGLPDSAHPLPNVVDLDVNYFGDWQRSDSSEAP